MLSAYFKAENIQMTLQYEAVFYKRSAVFLFEAPSLIQNCAMLGYFNCLDIH